MKCLASQSSPPAVVVGGGINGLGVVRSLGREGVATFLLDCDDADPAMRSRFPVKIRVADLGGNTIIDALLGLRARFSADPVLFLTHEATVEAICADQGRISAHYQFAMPRPDLMLRLMDKAQFQTLAESHGFPVPRAVVLRGGPQDAAEIDRLHYPCVLKPVIKTPAYNASFKKAYKLGSAAEVRAILASVNGAAEMIAQEWVEGGDDQIYFCLLYRDRSLRTVAAFAGRKLRSWPPATGGTASCLPAPEQAAELQRLSDAFFDAVGFFGLGSMEFKRDARTGRFVMIEPTVGRTDFQEEIATLNGVNLPYAAYCAETGRCVPPAALVGPQAAWAVGSIDRWSRELQGQSHHGFPAGLRRRDALWRLSDPIPWCYEMSQRLKAKLSANRRAAG